MKQYKLLSLPIPFAHHVDTVYICFCNDFIFAKFKFFRGWKHVRDFFGRIKLLSIGLYFQIDGQL